MLRLYCPDLKSGEMELPPEEAHHATASLRAKVGTPLVLFDGQGHEATGSLVSISKRSVRASVGEIRTREFDCAYRLTIAIALGKAHRQSYVVEKCTELGVDQIWPMITERSVTKPREAAVDKWSRRAIEAAKQSGRAHVPTIEAPQRLADVIARASDFAARAMADVPSDAVTNDESRITPAPLTSPPLRGGLRGGEEVRNCPPSSQSTIDDRRSPLTSPPPRGGLRGGEDTGTPPASQSFLDVLRSCSSGSRVLCLVGPEGGWSDAEKNAARAAGLTFVRLAPTILRTETAAVTACAAAALLGDRPANG